MKFLDLRIATRLGVGFGFVLVLMTVMVGTGIVVLRNLNVETDYMINDAVAKERLVNEWYGATLINGVRTITMVKNADAASQRLVDTQIKETSERIGELQQQLDKLIASPTGKALYGEASARREAYRSAREAVQKAKSSGDLDGASKIAQERMQPALNDYLAAIKSLSEHQKEKAAATALKVADMGATGQYVLGVVWCLALLTGVFATVWITRSITQPLNNAINLAETVARGDLSVHAVARTRDETGRLLLALDTMRQNLLNIVTQVRNSTDSIAAASSQIANGNLDLSSRTEQQAGSLEETASSMEELASTVSHNGASVARANALAESASDQAVGGGLVVARVVDTMNAISESAAKIVEIIGVIDGIAFQTNILALNAAVEAAHAGEQGRGFAVVAAEVRDLARRSSDAAKQIKSLIGESVEKVDAGSKLVTQAGAAMDDIVDSVKRVAGLIGEIGAAGSEQEAGILQINQAISQMDSVTQENAALVEEAAAAAQALNDQAIALTEVVGVFKLDNTNKHPVAVARSLAKHSIARLELNANGKSVGKVTAIQIANNAKPAPRLGAPGKLIALSAANAVSRRRVE